MPSATPDRSRPLIDHRVRGPSSGRGFRRRKNVAPETEGGTKRHFSAASPVVDERGEERSSERCLPPSAAVNRARVVLEALRNALARAGYSFER